MIKNRKTALLFLILASLWSGQAMAQTDETPPADEVSEPAGEADEALPAAVEKRMAEQEAKFQAQLEALEKKNEEEIEALRTEMLEEEEDYAALGDGEETFTKYFQIYGFFDLTFYKYFMSDDSAFKIFINDKSSYLIN